LTVAVAPLTGSLLVSFQYGPDDTGLGWAIAMDNPVLAWLVDETSAVEPSPVILGSLPPPPPFPPTAPVVSPPWAVREGTTWFVPNVARGSSSLMFTAIATNNGARRPIYSNFADPTLQAEWRQWAEQNPTLALAAPPNVGTTDDGGTGAGVESGGTIAPHQ
jgi:hypothetical protein